jgi:hypothetical protein
MKLLAAYALALLAFAACCGLVSDAKESVSHSAPSGYWPGVVVGTCSETQRANWGASAREGELHCRLKVAGVAGAWPRARYYGVDCRASYAKGDPVWVPGGAGRVLPRRPGDVAPQVPR